MERRRKRRIEENKRKMIEDIILGVLVCMTFISMIYLGFIGASVHEEIYRQRDMEYRTIYPERSIYENRDI